MFDSLFYKAFVGEGRCSGGWPAAARIAAAVLVIGGAFAAPPALAGAGQNDDVQARLEALERENAAIRKENAALRANKRLREQNATLKPVSAPLAATQAVAKPDPFAAYAADLPVAYKAAPVESRALFRVWGEGGAIWSGGDPITQDFGLHDFTGTNGLLGAAFSPQLPTIPGRFDMVPKVGWEAATGFDYRFANSPWHVSGQFRYGESGTASGLASSSGSIDPVILAALAPGFTSAGGNESFAATYKEKRWLADIAVGREIFGSGPDALQLKGGLRIAEFIGNLNTTDSAHRFETFAPVVAVPGTPAISSFTAESLSTINQRTSFLGAGPRIGVEGSVPFAGRWSFDYLGDAAVLFGTEKLSSIQVSATTLTPSFLNVLSFGGFSFTSAAQQFTTVFNGDIQVGISYWVSQNLKVGASYRLDAFIHVANESGMAANNLTPDRYIHGPRVTVTGQF